jgi:2-keto-4-pentenoate hydratase/2-oxohepta-3-ene-1,7-dioic acid hydratase in catechol pathway
MAADRKVVLKKANTSIGGKCFPGPARPPKGMTFLTISRNGVYSLGVKTSKGIIDVGAASRSLKIKAPAIIDDVIRGGDQGLTALIKAVLGSPAHPKLFLEEGEIEYGPCVTNPEKLLLMGFNYRKHAMEYNTPIPDYPVFFSKFNNALAGHKGVIKLPSHAASHFDYEVELVAVIGRTAHRIGREEALSYVFGYCIGNDLSARDLQFKTSQFLPGKTCDGFAPVGPYLVTADRIPDPGKLGLECYVNGERRQSGNTGDMIFSVADLISHASQIMTLKPGDMLFTGTPEGVVVGMPPEKRVWLKAGDEVVSTIEGLGELRFSLA